MSLLAAAVLLGLAATPPVASPAAPGLPDDGIRWTTIVAYDEVRVDVDTAHVGGAGPVSAWVRWSFAARVVSPSAWDQGVRSTIDAIEVDCTALASRTLRSTAFGADGAAIEAASVADDGAAWHRPGPGSVGRSVAEAVCALGATPAGASRR